MTRLQRRLRNLEAVMTDRSGLVPLSPAWIAHWTHTTDRILLGEVAEPVERIPIASVDWVLSTE
jgi:hypothetical protein